MSARRAVLARREAAPPPPLCRPMSEFDPSEPALVHDRRHDRMIPWSPSFQRSYERSARQQEPGVVAYDGLLLDGWLIAEEERHH
jgi:hypothetical protein